MRCDEIDKWLVGGGELLQEQPAGGVRRMFGPRTDAATHASFAAKSARWRAQ